MLNSKSFHVIDKDKVQGNIHIVGVGALGSRVVENLVRLNLTSKIIVYDMDQVEEKNLNNQKGLEVDLVDSLTRYFNKYFINATTTVTVTDDAGSASKQTVTIAMTFETPDGKKFDLSDVVTVKGSLFERYTHLNNTGVLRDTEDVE